LLSQADLYGFHGPWVFMGRVLLSRKTGLRTCAVLSPSQSINRLLSQSA